MAVFRLNSAATGSADGSSWANAFTTMAAAVAALAADGDVILVADTHVGSISVDTVYSLGFACAIISVDPATGNPRTMLAAGGTGYLGDLSSNSTIGFTGSKAFYVYGLTLRVTGSGMDAIRLGQASSSWIVDSCCLWVSASNTAARIWLGGNDVRTHIELRNCVYRFNHSAHRIRVMGNTKIVGGYVDSGYIAPSVLFVCDFADPGGLNLEVIGADLSHLSSGSLVESSATGTMTVRFAQCLLGSGFGIIGGTSGVSGANGHEVTVLDCSSGDVHGLYAYANNLGELRSDGTVYFTAGAAGQSWKITTNSFVTPFCPFLTPWVGLYQGPSLAAVTPYVEILRDGSATAYKDDEAWIELMAKVTSGSPMSTFYTDRVAVYNATPANQSAGAGLGAWTGESGTAWSGKVGLGASVTPVEVGDLAWRVAFGVPSAVIYVDPQLRV